MNLYYAFTGRIPGDDEDSYWTSNRPMTAEEANTSFREYMHADLDPSYIAALENECGDSLFINAVFTSTSPIDSP